MIPLILTADIVAQCKQTKRRVSDTYSGLRLSASLDGDFYLLEDIATIKVALKNISNAPITIYKKSGGGGRKIDVAPGPDEASLVS